MLPDSGLPGGMRAQPRNGSGLSSCGLQPIGLSKRCCNVPRREIIFREFDEVEAIRALARSRRAYAFAHYLARQKKPGKAEKSDSIKAQERMNSPRKRMSA